MGALSFHIRQYLPDAEGEDLEVREVLLRARDHAAALRGRTVSLRAFNLAAEAHEICGAFVYATNETLGRLSLAAKLCRHLVHAAILAEQMDDDEVAR